MVFKIIQGGARADFLSIIAKKIRSLPTDEEIFLIVPNNLKFKTEIKMLNLLNANETSFFSMPNLKIYSFNRLVWYFLNDSSYFQLPELTTSMKNMILTSILLEKNDELKVYRNFATDVGFIDLLRQQIEIFEQEGLTFKDLAGLRDSKLDLEKNADLALIYQRYEQIIAQPFRNEQSDFQNLAQHLESQDLSKTNFIFFDYLEMTKIETDLLKQLIVQAKDVYFLRYHDAVIDKNSIVENLQSEGVKPRFATYHSESNKQIASIFVNQQNVQEKRDIQIFRCSDRYTEVKKIALEITQLVRTKSARFSDFLIIGSQINDYEPFFNEIFPSYQIPFLGEFTNSMTHASVTYLLKKILDLVRGQIKLTDLFDLLKTQKILDLSEEIIFDAENFALKLGITGRDFLSLEMTGEIFKRSFAKNPQQLDNFLLVKKMTQELLIPLINDLKKGTQALDYSNIIYDFFVDSGILDKFNQKRSELEATGKQLASDQIEQEVNNFVKLLDEMVSIFKDQKLSFNNFAQILLNGFKTKTYAMVPSVMDEVQIADLNKINLADYKYVWIVNAVDGNLPFNHEPNELLFSTEELAAIANETGDQFLLRYCVNSKNDSEQKLNYLMMSFAQTKLFISFPTHDQDLTLLPSTYLNVLRDKFQIPFEDFSDLPDATNFRDRLSFSNPALTDLVQVIREALVKQEKISDDWSNLFYWFQQNRNDELEQVLDALTINDNHEVDPALIEEIFNRQILLSITNMETYFRNPYEFFVKYVLKVRERSISEVNPLVSGLVFHDVLDQFFKILKSSGSTIKNLADEELVTITHQVYKEVIRDQHLEFLLNDALDRFNLELLEQTVTSTLRSIKMQGITAKTLFTEKSFGMNGDEIQPIFMLDDSRSLKLNGKIDRLDTVGNFFNVIDYKSSKRKFDLNDFYNGLDLQLITYLQILKNYYFKAPTQKIGGSFFYQIQDPIIEHAKVGANFDQTWLKNYQYNGLFLNDENYLQLISDDLSKNNLKWRDLFPTPKTAKQQNAYTEDEFKVIFAYNQKRFQTLAELIYQGSFPQKLLFRTFDEVKSYRNNSYQSILLFDPELNHDFRIWHPRTPADLLNLMKGDFHE
ncbi:PD-(D/E)XK nuclease family protein [Xylocopilactobacillus apicola]|uniref:ATP-dependent helicase/deoxyribonuclease subunit B n=1 Tax=Xylocopilactobacillus apicola TaxID=2932184 RepID=A0AAU9CWN0_9LACO|nr:PD-(D/E)XK nuclease family protein [Xylocopilactobacillus apicola]BDR58379.1 ATP-dependent helicase/deoxyribonuclease subunit B [Xylocopilactobacillus apicola]